MTDPGVGLSRCLARRAPTNSRMCPALIEAVVDPDKPPFGETLKPVQAQNIAQAFERGEGNRERMASNLLEEDRVAVSAAVQYPKDELSKTST